MIKNIIFILGMVIVLGSITYNASAMTPIMDEICNNGIDDDGNGLIDAFDPECSCADNLLSVDYEISIVFPCNNPTVLSVPVIAGLNYQWYLDGVPLSGQTFPTFGAALDQFDQSNQFYIHISDNMDCILLGPVSIDPCLDFEICDNGFDDDGDGLVDAFDPDCFCQNINNEEGQTLIQNSGFEEHTGCCTVMQLGDSCIDGWEVIGGTPDYYGVDCSTSSEVIEIESFLVDVFDDSFVAIGTAANYSETLGSCLSTPMIAGNKYKTEIKVNLPDPILNTLGNNIELALYGFSGPCPDFSTLIGPSEVNFCNSSLPAQGIELITIGVMDVLNFEFKNFEAIITPTSNITYVALSIRCNDSNQGLVVFQVASVEITELLSSSWEYNEEISISDPCSNSVTFSVPDADSLSYQWYVDGVPILDEVSSSLDIIPGIFTEANHFHVNVYNDNGCVLLGPANIVSFNISPTEISASICEGGIYTLEGIDFFEADIYEILLQSVDGCDSLLRLDLSIDPYQASSVMADICEGESYDFFERTLTLSGTYMDTIESANSCDTIVTLDLSVIDISIELLEANICEGDTYSFDGLELSTSGTYQDTMTSSFGCDSIVVLDLTIINNSEETVFESICEGETYDFNGQILSLEGIYLDTLTNGMGCDSIAKLILGFSNYIRAELNVTICEGESYFFDNMNITQEGIYNDTIFNAMTCDSIVILDLDVYEDLESSFQDFICFGDSYDFGGNELFETGIYRDTLVSTLGCDSIEILELTVFDKNEVSVFEEICEGDFYDFNGQMISDEGIYLDTLSGQMGCDSIIELMLGFSAELRADLTAEICQGDSYFFMNMDLTQEGIYVDTISNTAGCDSLIVLDLKLLETSIFSYQYSICLGDMYNFNGEDVFLAGIYSDTLQNSIGCDSIIVLDLIIDEPSMYSFQDSICLGNMYDFGGEEIFEPGIYLDTLQNQRGCDSIVTLTLLEIEQYEIFLNEIICNGDEFVFGAESFDQSGEYSLILESSNGCDSVLNLSLSILPSLVGDTTYATISQGEVFDFNNEEFDQQGIFEVVIPSDMGCDSLVVLDLSITGDVYVPNIFSTSSVSGNDRFIVVSKEDIVISEYQIFDRWGSLVFVKENFRIRDGEENFWDGYINNQAAVKGVYVYYIIYTNASNEQEELVGTVTLL